MRVVCDQYSHSLSRFLKLKGKRISTCLDDKSLLISQDLPGDLPLSFQELQRLDINALKMQCSQPQNLVFRETDEKNIHKKRKIIIADDEQENYFRSENNNFIDRRFIFLSKKDCHSIFQTEGWQPSGSVLFVPLIEDVLVNTQNIEQFSCSEGDFFVADQSGQYSQTLSGNLSERATRSNCHRYVSSSKESRKPCNVLHLWRFCSNKNKLFVSRSFLFKNPQDYFEVRQALLKL